MNEGSSILNLNNGFEGEIPAIFRQNEKKAEFAMKFAFPACQL